MKEIRQILDTQADVDKAVIALLADIAGSWQEEGECVPVPKIMAKIREWQQDSRRLLDELEP